MPTKAELEARVAELEAQLGHGDLTEDLAKFGLRICPDDGRICGPEMHGGQMIECGPGCKAGRG